MAKGGARNRSGPSKDPMSLRSAQSGHTVTELPNEGYSGEAPDFPLMAYSVMRWETEDKRRFQVVDTEATAAFREREADLWALVWTYPQAVAWAREPWRWQTVGMWVRTTVVCESSEATAADKGAIHRFADQIGLTPAGLRENNWAIAHSQIPAAPATPTEADQPHQPSARDRFTVVDGAGA